MTLHEFGHVWALHEHQHQGGIHWDREQVFAHTSDQWMGEAQTKQCTGRRGGSQFLASAFDRSIMLYPIPQS